MSILESFGDKEHRALNAMQDEFTDETMQRRITRALPDDHRTAEDAAHIAGLLYEKAKGNPAAVTDEMLTAVTEEYVATRNAAKGGA